MTTIEDNRSPEVKLLSIMVRGCYDTQMLRMQHGIRLVANFRARLYGTPVVKETEPENEEDKKKEADKILELLRKDYKMLMHGVARNRTLPDERGFKGTPLISTHSELILVHNYIRLQLHEEQGFALLDKQLSLIPIFNEFLDSKVHKKQKGVGPAMAGVIISRLDPAKARHVSSFWKYAGLDVGPDGRGRSRREEHLVLREYKDKRGKIKTRRSITYDPWLKTKLVGVLAGSFIRTGSPWREVYDGYKHRLESDPARQKCTAVEYKKAHDAGEDTSQLWAPSRIDHAAKRYMVKQFLAELWLKWRELEGLPVSEPYAVAKLGHRPHAA